LAGDLGLGPQEVHAKAREVLDFWFGEVTPERHFARDEGLDRTIRTRFGPLRDFVLGSGAAGWRDDPETLLAAIVLLDQFSRNIHRGTAEAFAGDPLAQELACIAIDRGWDGAMPRAQRQFAYMPLMHAEDPELQTLCLECFDELGDEESLAYARDHAEVIARFGRFPTRNAALGRDSTHDEAKYLSEPGAGW
jgi:uncharacterized protein (DUF924 family)